MSLDLDHGNTFASAACLDTATGRCTPYVRVKWWRGLWEKRMVPAADVRAPQVAVPMPGEAA